jgi:hypothetical protein
MIRHWLVGAAALMVTSGVALAQSATSGEAGNLSARDVVGKRLLDDDGAMIGWIKSATDRSAMVTTPAGKRIEVQMAELSLGFGPHTVIEEGNSGADKLNGAEAATLK